MIQTRIKQRYDALSNWLLNDIVLLAGEVAIVDCGNQQTRFKIGDGSKTFSQLPFIDKHIAAESISQGINAYSVPYGLASGAYLSANANFSQAFGYASETQSSDSYAFTWNGDDTRAIGDNYQSHGKGTFNINPLSGLSGVFVGEQNLAELLDSNSGNNITIDNRISGICQQSDLSVVKLDALEYSNLLTSNQLLSNALYVVENDHIDAYGEQIKNVAYPIDLSDAATKEYVDYSLSNVEIPKDLSAFTNSPGYLASNDVSDYCYFKNETSSASEISMALTSIDVGNKVFIDDRISGTVEQTDLSIVHLSSSEYEQLSANHQLLSNALYIVEDSFTNNYGKQIKNVADPTDSTDVTNKQYVDNAISNIQIPTDLSAFTNSPGYLTEHQSLSGYYQKSETSSANEISIAFASIDTGNKIFIDDKISSVSGYSDISVVKLGASEYSNLLTSDSLLSNALYIVQDDHIDAYGQQLKNLAEPTDLSDATTKGYVDNAIPNDLSDLSNSPGYVTSASISASLADIQKSIFQSISDPAASVRSLQETLISVLNILRG